jgi:hypothetical protein
MNEEANNLWIVQAPKQITPVPVGFHTGAFAGVDDVKLQDGSLKWRFSWEVKAGPEQGKVASALVNQGINPNTHAGRLIAGLLGRPIVVGENVKTAIDGCRGKTFLVSVQPGPKGGKPSVQSVGLPPQM